MGYIKHHTIVVTGDEESIIKCRTKAISIFKKKVGKDLVSKIIGHGMNGYFSFFVAPDGSNEGWSLSYEGNLARLKLIKFLKKEKIDFVEVMFGGDDNYAEITN